MKVALIEGSLNDQSRLEETVFKNRGVKDYIKYMNLDDSCLISPYKLDNISEAAQKLLEHLEKKSVITILVDCDVDGYTSGALMYMYLKDLGYDGTIRYVLHSEKKHGISSDVTIPDDTNLLIIPDAGTDDIEQCKCLNEHNVDVIVLDHHIPESDELNPYAIVVNNKACEYENKDLSGVGIVYKFCQVLDDMTWNAFADKYLDIVAVGNIGDVMDLRSYETKRLAIKGMARIINPLILAIVEKNSYSIKGDPNINDITYYVVPAMNAIVRAGTLEEKELMFKALIGDMQLFSYTKRGTDIPIEETTPQRVARISGSCKYRQNKDKEKAVESLCAEIEKRGVNKNKIIFCNAGSSISNTLTGLVAANIASKYGKPCLLLRKNKEGTEFSGSMRNVDGSPIDDLRAFLLNTGLFNYVKGHENAAGVSIKKENVVPAMNMCNEILKDVDLSGRHMVDFELYYDELNVSVFRKVNALNRVWCSRVGEPLFYIKNVVITKDKVMLLGKEKNTLKFIDDEGINFLFFKDEVLVDWYNDFRESEEIVVNIVCKVGINHYGSTVSLQAVVDDYEIVVDCEVM